jgi:hypothetical protein
MAAENLVVLVGYPIRRMRNLGAKYSQPFRKRELQFVWEKCLGVARETVELANW